MIGRKSTIPNEESFLILSVCFMIIILLNNLFDSEIMTCEFQLTATLEGVNKFLSDHIDGESDGPRKTLQNFKIAVSPTGEIVVFAKSTWLLVCGSKWDSSITDGARIKYSPSWHGHINCKPGEEITSIFCLPFFSQGQTSLGCADWICLILGFSSGFIKFYTDRMQELACSILHEEKITDIKCFVSTPVLQGKHQKYENTDIYVLYKSVICILNKYQLMQTLQNKRNELAKGFPIKKNETESYLSVDFKKYSFVGQEEVTDACFLGQTLVSSFNTFDHLVTASLVGGFNSNYRASPPQTSLIVTSGRRPFIGFHYTLEGANSPVLTDVALAVASKIKNSVTATLPDWFGFGSKKSTHSEKPKELSQEYAEKLTCRFGLCDLWRQGQSIIVSPDGMFSAVADSLGRVILINNTSGIAHRLWKGFRDAQCGFLQVQEDVKKLRKSKENTLNVQPRQGLFIVIYAPKKGLIEIFTTQHGRHVMNFKVTKYGHLLYTPNTAQMGPNISAGGFNLNQNQVIFISEEGFYEISIPFHCALAEDNSKISRDLHVLKKMKMLLKTRNSNNSKFVEEIEKCARELKTGEVKLHAIESMITYKNVTFEAFKSVLNVFLETLQKEECVEPASKKIVAFAKLILDLLLLYEFLMSLQDLSSNYKNSGESNINIDSLSEKLKLPQNELNIILKVVQQIMEIEKTNQQTTKVAFAEKKSAKLIQYLTCFDFDSFLNSLDKNEKQEEMKESHNFTLNLKLEGKENNLSYLGEVFFKGIFNSFSTFDQWKNSVAKCCLNPQCLALCLISYWCNKELAKDIFPEVLFFIEVLKFICSLDDANVMAVEDNIESPWWKELRNLIAGNSFTIHGIFAALCCRSVTIFIEQEREISLMYNSEKKLITKANEDSYTNETTTLNSDWETISKDSCQWDILIVQLQDVALLNAVLKLTFKTQNCITEIPFDFEQQCLTSIQAKGLGRISELVAKWLIQFGFNPTDLIDTNDLEFQDSGIEKEVVTKGSELIFPIDKANQDKNCYENLNGVLEYLALLKTRFPYSLTSSSLLSNMCWEYFAHWFKNVCDVHFLETAIQYLKVIPSHRIKYGICYLSWNTYLEQKFETLAKMINRIGKVPRDKLCVQEIGLRNDQVPVFLKFITELLRIMLHTEIDDKSNFRNNKEAIWQTGSTLTTSSLVIIVLSQPVIDSDLILFQLQLSISLFMMSSLNVKHQRVFSSLFDSVERVSLIQSGTSQLSSHYQNLKLKNSRTEFLKKCLSAAVQTVEIVEYIPPVSSDEFSDIVPTTTLKVENYRSWLQLCFELAGMWAVPLEDLRKHQICELYFSELDRLAEEVIPSVNDTAVLASQLLVLGGKRLKYLIQDSDNFSKTLTKLSANLSEWLHTLELENFTYHGTIDDIEVLMRYSAKWLPEGHCDQKLAFAVIESLSFLKTKALKELPENI